MQASSSDSDHPPQTQQQEDLVRTELEHEVPCLEEKQRTEHQGFATKREDDEEDDIDCESKRLPTSLSSMPPHSACSFPPCDQDFGSNSSEQLVNDARPCKPDVASTRQEQTLPSSLSSWTCSDELLFPTKLFYMLNDAHEKGFEHIVSWGHGPSSFNVHQKKAFEDLVLPKYFKMTKYKSFTRQLHNYEFQWIRGGPDKGGYCHKYFSRDGTNVDQLLSRKALALAQSNIVVSTSTSEKTPQDPSLPIEGVRRWSAPELLGGGSRHSSEDGKPNVKAYDTGMCMPTLQTSVSCTSLLEGHHNSVELERSESDPMNVSTHSGGYLLPPLAAQLWRPTSSVSSRHESHSSMAFSNHGGGKLHQINQNDTLNTFLTTSENHLGLLSNMQDSFYGGVALAPTPTLPFGSGSGLVGGLSGAPASFVHHTTRSLSDLPLPNQGMSFSGISGQSGLLSTPMPGFTTSQFLSGPPRGPPSAPSSTTTPTLPATMMMDRDDVLVNLRKSLKTTSSSSAMVRSSTPVGMDGAIDQNIEKFPTRLMFMEEDDTITTPTFPIPPNTPSTTTHIPSIMEPRTIEEMMQDDENPFR